MSTPAHPPTVGVPTEHADGERRVALTPDAVKALVDRGLGVIVEAGAGNGARIEDHAYVAAGAAIGDPWSAAIVAKVTAPTPAEVSHLRAGTILIGLLDPAGSPTIAASLTAAGVVGLAMESIPRISRAQAMDALSSQSTVAGYEAVLIAASTCTRFFPMLTTAAGTMPPARVLVLGVGVAGLQALATAHRLGARTTGYDVRPEVADQVRSVGAQWLDLGIEASGAGGYAAELTGEQRATQQRALTEAIKGFDVVITTALVPGRAAPRMVTAGAVRGMRSGSVVVDLAAATGGNCELTVGGQTVVDHGVSIVGPVAVTSALAEHASQLYARNVRELIGLLLGDDGMHALDTDEILMGARVTQAPPHPVAAPIHSPAEAPEASRVSTQTTQTAAR